MRTIWKFPFGASNRPTIEMPVGAKVLTVQIQDGLITLWAEVDSKAFRTARYFRVFGTGFEMPREAAGYADVYIGTVQHGGFVWHVYEELRA